MPNPIFSINKIAITSNKKKLLFINNFQIHRGAVYMIDGDSASGKTLFLNVLNGEKKLTSGELLYENKSIQLLMKNIRNQEIYTLKQCNKVPWGSVHKFLYKTIKLFNHIDNVDKSISEISKKLDLTLLHDRKCSSLTPSQFRRVFLAAAIASDTKVLLIDELELHLSKKYVSIISKILYKKANYDGVTILFTTQNMDIFNKSLSSVRITLDSGRISSVRSKNKK